MILTQTNDILSILMVPSNASSLINTNSSNSLTLVVAGNLCRIVDASVNLNFEKHINIQRR